MPLASELLTAFFPDSEQGLIVGGQVARELAERFGTPLYVFDAAILRRRLREVMAALGPRVEILYAVKANPNAAVVRTLFRAGAGAEVASAGEIHIAKAAGVPGASIQFAGPGKDRADLEAAAEHGVFNLNVESAAEYEAIARLARHAGHRPGIALRINPPSGASRARMKMGGGSQKFGFEPEQVPALLDRIRNEDMVALNGLHIYAGTQTFDANAWATSARFIVDLANRLEEETGHPLTTLNFGGGFGVPCFEGDTPFDLDAAAATVREIIASDGRPERRYFVELGRYLTAPAGVYLTRVLYMKQARAKHHAILDGGLHHHSAAAGVGSIIKRTFPFVVCDRPDAEGQEDYCLGGPLCTPADELGAAVRLPRLQVGSLVGILVSGAYGLTFSNTKFLSHPTPAEVLVDAGRAHLVRERGRISDAMHGQRLPEEGMGG